jgi:hypothetical protein
MTVENVRANYHNGKKRLFEVLEAKDDICMPDDFMLTSDIIKISQVLTSPIFMMESQ